MRPAPRNANDLALPRVAPSARQFEGAVERDPVRALAQIEAARQALAEEQSRLDSLRRLALLRCKDEIGLNATELVSILGMPNAARRERESSASRVRQLLLEGRREFDQPAGLTAGGRPPAYDDLLTREFLEAALASGRSYVDIAAELGIGAATVSRYVHRYELTPGPDPQEGDDAAQASAEVLA